MDHFPVALDLLNSKKLCGPNIGMLDVYPEAMACNVGRLCSDLKGGQKEDKRRTKGG